MNAKAPPSPCTSISASTLRACSICARASFAAWRAVRTGASDTRARARSLRSSIPSSMIFELYDRNSIRKASFSIRTCVRYSSSRLRFAFDLGLPEKAGRRAGVTRRTDLIDLQEHNVAAAVDPRFEQPLRVPGFFALAPHFLARPRPVRDFPARKRTLQRAFVHH